MTTNLDEWIRNLEQRVTDAVDETVQELAVYSEALIRSNVEGNRPKTRSSVGHRMTGRRSAAVGLFFATKYSGSTNTETHRQFRRTCRLIRPALVKRLVKTLNTKLQGE